MMLRKKEGFDGQRVINLPRKILSKHYIEHTALSSIYVTDIGYYPKAQYHYRKRESGSEQHILIYCLEGSGTLEIYDQVLTINPSNFILIPKGTPHRYSASELNPWTIYWIHFKGPAADQLVDSYLNRTESVKGQIDYQDSRVELFEDIYANLEMGYSTDNLIYSNVALMHFIVTFIYTDNYLTFKKQNTNSIVNDAINFMKDHIDEMLPLNTMAQSVNLSVSHFSFTFKKKTGYSPIEYFNHLKVQSACQYLLLTDLHIKEIAIKLGIDDPYYFSRLFSKVMGTSPVAYRNKRVS